MGAVYHWNIDWNSLSKIGIYETLIQERGFAEMDEYVLDHIGLPFQSEKAKELSNYLYRYLSLYCAVLLDLKPTNQSMALIVQGAKAMYAFGMAYEMNRLGMK